VTPHPDPRERTDDGFTLVELIVVMAVFAVIGSSLVGMIMIWLNTSQGTTTAAISSTDSQTLATAFAADLSSTTVPSLPTQTTCVTFTDYPLTWSAGGHTYVADYSVAGSTLQRRLSVDGAAGTTLTMVHFLQAATPVCVSALGTSRTMTVNTSVPGPVGIAPAAVSSTFAVTGYGRGAPVTALLGSYSAFVSATPFFLYGTFSDNVPSSSISNVTYYYCPNPACATKSTMASFNSPYGGTNEGTLGTNPAYSLLVNFGPAGGFPGGNPPDGTYSIEALVTYTTGGTPASQVVTSTLVAGTLDTVAPVVTMTAPSNSSSTSNTMPTFGGAAGAVAVTASSSADLAPITVKIYSGTTTGGALVQTLATSAAGGAWTVAPTIALAANATYTAQASQVDGAGNIGLSSPSTFVIDTTAPVVTIATPATHNIKPPYSGTNGVLTASATTTADGTTITVRVYLGTGTGGALQQTLTTTATGSTWTVTPTVILGANTTYTAQASQTDGAGNTGLSAAVTFVA
jgi:prepilin-type N-terminal cleavage/methylation domain-containing protein